jgi:hypothetical protein
MASVRVGFSPVLLGNVIVDVDIHWISLCMCFVAICCIGVGALSLAVVLCCASAAASSPPMGSKLMTLLT